MNKEESQINPPRWSLRLLRLFIRKEFLEEIEGDMEEVYLDNLEKYTTKKARRLYNREVFKLMRPALSKPLSGTQKLNYYGMLRHNLLLSLRIFKRYKSSFLINLTGLATGLACVLFIYLWVSDERSIDKFHEHDDRLYQVMGNYDQADGISTWNGTSALLADALAEEIPEIEKAVSSTDPDWLINFDLSLDESKFKAIGKHVGQDYFNLFSYELIDGNADQVLADKNALVISDRLAERLFNSTENVIGKTISWESMGIKGQSAITGLFKAPPVNSTDQFDFLLHIDQYTDFFGKSWQNPGTVTYALLKEGTDIEAVNQKIVDFIKGKIPDSNKTIFLSKYSDNYLYGTYENGVQAGGRIEYVRLFSLIALFILVIACINFMNLSTARASRRVKEVGVKKAVGASRSALIFQHLSESVLMAFIALIVAIGLVGLLLPQFNQITDKSLVLNFDPGLITSAILITAITGFISGSYPALYLSGFNPSAVLKGIIKGSVGELWIRKGLVIFQFSLSIMFIVGVLVVFQQMQMIQTKNLGFDKDQIVYFEREGKTVEDLGAFLQGVKNIPGVQSASAINNDFFNAPGVDEFTWEGKLDDQVNFKRYIVYYDFIETFGVELLEGRDFSEEFPLRDEWQIILNEKGVEAMGLTDPIGKKAKLWGLDARIVGVVKDFHFASLHEPVGPMFFHLDPRFLLNAMVKIQAGTERETLDRLESFYTSFNPGYTLNYKFLDQDFQKQYQSENKVATLSRYFAGLAIVISCLGLLGLVAFSAERKMKEIGIRKILGSGNLRIVYMLSGDFTKMVVAAIVIALPISYFLTKDWLNGFAYRIELEWWFFAGAGLIGLVIAWLTVGYQTIKASRVNPAQCLRNE